MALPPVSAAVREMHMQLRYGNDLCRRVHPDTPHTPPTRSLIEERYSPLVSLAVALRCEYDRFETGKGHCDRYASEVGFTRCLPCRVRDEAERLVRS